MKTIGILGGMAFPSSMEYYRIINEHVNESLGGCHSAMVVLCSVDFAIVKKLQDQEKWDELADFLSATANKHLANADFLVIATNTVHKVAEKIEAATGKKILHIGDVTALAIKQSKLSKIGLIGTRFTMMEKFYKDRIAGYGIEVAVPDISDINRINTIIYNQLVNGIILPESRKILEDIIRTMVTEQNCEGIILGCTELPLLFSSEEKTCCGVPLFRTTEIHALAAAGYALLLAV